MACIVTLSWHCLLSVWFIDSLEGVVTSVEAATMAALAQLIMLHWTAVRLTSWSVVLDFHFLAELSHFNCGSRSQCGQHHFFVMGTSCNDKHDRWNCPHGQSLLLQVWYSSLAAGWPLQKTYTSQPYCQWKCSSPNTKSKDFSDYATSYKCFHTQGVLMVCNNQFAN